MLLESTDTQVPPAYPFAREAAPHLEGNATSGWLVSAGTC